MYHLRIGYPFAWKTIRVLGDATLAAFVRSGNDWIPGCAEQQS